jgi:SAM-dependent methyltransferase
MVNHSNQELKPAQLLLEYETLFTEEALPGPILDLACGSGQNGIFLAQKGLPVICCDKSPEALNRVKQLAAKNGVTVKLWQVDLEESETNPLGKDLYGGIIVFRYLYRPLILGIKEALKKSGILVYETFTIDQPKFGKPYNPNFLLKPGELLAWFRDWKIMHHFEGIKDYPPRAIAQIVCQKP